MAVFLALRADCEQALKLIASLALVAFALVFQGLARYHAGHNDFAKSQGFAVLESALKQVLKN